MKDGFSRATAVALLVFAGLFPRSGTAQEGASSIRAGTRLLKEGDRLADEGQFTEAVIRYKRGFERILPELRKLPFRHEVRRDVTKREHLKALLLRELDEDMTPAEFRANEMAFKAFGLVPRDFRLKEVLAQLYSEEVAAFYDPKTKTMHLIEEPKPDAKKPARPGLLERLFGKKSEFDQDENKVVIAHELTHALADQHYDLDALDKLVKKDDDRALALSALIEGEATLAMIGASMDDWDGKQVVKLPADSLDWTFSLLAPFLPMMGGGKTLRQSPAIIAESMLFPYLKGLVFCAKLANDGGWKAIDEAYGELPMSTEQVLHPEKYRARPDRPMAIDLGRLPPGAGWTELGRNVLGEMQLGVLLRRHGGKSAAAGWDGDRYAVFEGPQGGLGLVWLSTWDSEDDAREFMTAYVAAQTDKLGKVSRPPRPVPDTLWRNAGEFLYVIQRRGLDVAVIEGFPPAVTPALLEAAFRATKTELKPDRPRQAPDQAGPKPQPSDHPPTRRAGAGRP